MAMEGNDLPPIIVKKKGHGGGHHGGAWKVAYADFVTAMMALFIVLWILSSSEKVKQAVSGYFKDPIGFEKGGYKTPLPGRGAGIIDMGGGVNEEVMSRATESKRLEELGKQISGELKGDPNFSAIINNIKFEPTNEGLRIEMIEEGNNIFFDLGSAQLNSKAVAILHIISKQLVKLPNKIAIEGHTDSRPFSSASMPGKTNWELSEERANAARRELVNVEGGVKDSQLDGIVGYADKRLRDPNDPYNLVNRRISIIVRYSTK